MQEGETIADRYRVMRRVEAEQQLGWETWEASDLGACREGKLVAILEPGPEFGKDALRAIFGATNHDGFVREQELIEHEGRTIVVCDFPGPPLTLDSNFHDLRDALERAVEALEYLHERGIVHRNLPMGLRRSEDGKLQIWMTPSARAYRLEGLRMRQPTAVLSTIEARDGEIGPRADVAQLVAHFDELLRGLPRFGLNVFRGEVTDLLERAKGPLDDRPTAAQLRKALRRQEDELRGALNENETSLRKKEEEIKNAQRHHNESEARWSARHTYSLMSIGAIAVTFTVAGVHMSEQDAHKSLSGLVWKRSAAAGVLVARAETSVRQYQVCVDHGSCPKPTTDIQCNWNKGHDYARHPMNCVSYAEARAFCEWEGGRLIKRKEWQLEYATLEEPMSCDNAVLAGCGLPPGTKVAGTPPKGRSASNIVDLPGNVFEWTHGLEEDIGVALGGSFETRQVVGMAPLSVSKSANYRDPTIGFRCARPEIPSKWLDWVSND